MNNATRIFDSKDLPPGEPQISSAPYTHYNYYSYNSQPQLNATRMSAPIVFHPLHSYPMPYSVPFAVDTPRNQYQNVPLAEFYTHPVRYNNNYKMPVYWNTNYRHKDNTFGESQCESRSLKQSTPTTNNLNELG